MITESFRQLPVRWFNLAAFMFCAALLAYAYYSQYHDGLEPCPLCILQRVALILLAVGFLLAGLHNPGAAGQRVYAVAIAIAAGLGASIAGRHAWLQQFPPDVIPDCGGGLAYMLEILPLSEALRIVFAGSGECTEITWSFLGLSMPAWVLLWFLALGVAGTIKNWPVSSKS